MVRMSQDDAKNAAGTATPRLVLRKLFFFFGLDLGKLAKPSYQTVLERILGKRNKSFPVLLSHTSVWWRT